METCYSSWIQSNKILLGNKKYTWLFLNISFKTRLFFIGVNFKHEYLRSRASTCVSLSSPSSHLLAIYRLSRYSCLYLGSLHPRIFLKTTLTYLKEKKDSKHLCFKFHIFFFLWLMTSRSAWPLYATLMIIVR